MVKKYLVIIIFLIAGFKSKAQDLSEKLTAAAMKTWPDTAKNAYQNGFLMQAMADVWQSTAQADHYNYIKKSVNSLLEQNDFATLKLMPQTVNAIRLLYNVSGEEKYYKALLKLNQSDFTFDPDLSSPKQKITQPAFNQLLNRLTQKSADGTISFKTTDANEAGKLISAANNLKLAAIPKSGNGKTVMLDSYFNNEYLKNAAGQTVSFHYKWDELDNNGFYFFKNVFQYRGAKTATLNAAPTAQNLKGSDIYIIVDPDTQKETEKPNYVNQQDATAVADWVKAGGVLLVLANDAGNCDLEHLNILTEKFGMHFNEDSRNKVTGNQFEMGALQIPPTDPVFKTAKKVYIKEISTFKLSPPAVASFTEGKEVIVATAKYGKGSVFAVGDPWFYNEYTDGRKLPASFDNFKACQDLVSWLLKQVPAK